MRMIARIAAAAAYLNLKSKMQLVGRLFLVQRIVLAPSLDFSFSTTRTLATICTLAQALICTEPRALMHTAYLSMCNLFFAS